MRGDIDDLRRDVDSLLQRSRADAEEVSRLAALLDETGLLQTRLALLTRIAATTGEAVAPLQTPLDEVLLTVRRIAADLAPLPATLQQLLSSITNLLEAGGASQTEKVTSQPLQPGSQYVANSAGALRCRPSVAKVSEDNVQMLLTRLDHIARVVEAGYHENLFWLRKIHNGSAVYLGDNTAITHLDNGLRIFVDTRSQDLGVHLLHTGNWEENYTAAFRKMLCSGARVVDVGANLGWYSLVAAPLVGPGGRVYAIEPNPDLARLVHASFRTNGFDGFCQIFQVAVGDAPGIVDLVADPVMPGGGYIRPAAHSVGDGASAYTRVAVMPLDDLLAKDPAPIDVIKMDIEGWEGMALRGMQNILDRSPNLRFLIEWGLAQDNTPAPRSEIAATLGERGYLPFHVQGDGSLRATSWDSAVQESVLTNLVLLKHDDALAADPAGL